MSNVWTELLELGIEKESIYPTVEKTFSPTPNLPKSQFREHVLLAVRKSTGKAFLADEAIQVSLIADRIWDAWPNV